MSWLKRAQEGGDIGDRIKQNIRSDPFFVALFRKNQIPMKLLDNLDIQVKRLEGSFCEANDEQILIDDRLAKDPSLFGENFHFIAHEIFHWLRRQREKMSYFADPEEVEGFTVGIAYALAKGDPKVEERFLPLIQINIPDDNKAREFLRQRIMEAKKLLATLGQ